MSEVLDPQAARKAAHSEPEDAKLVAVLLSISKSTRALVGLKLNEVGFHNGQDELLLALDTSTPISVSKLAGELNVRPSTVSKMLDRLIDARTVERTPISRMRGGQWCGSRPSDWKRGSAFSTCG